jgi:hypothetical protein
LQFKAWQATVFIRDESPGCCVINVSRLFVRHRASCLCIGHSLCNTGHSYRYSMEGAQRMAKRPGNTRFPVAKYRTIQLRKVHLFTVYYTLILC